MIHAARTVAVVVISALAFAVTPASPRTSDEGLASGPYYYNAGRRVPIVASTTRVALRTTSASKTGEIASSVETIDGVVGVRDIRAGGIIEVRLASTSSIPSALAAVGRSSGATLLPVFHEP